MRSFSWSAAVFDEAHRLKGLNSATRQAVEEMDIGWKLLLTGGSGAGAALRSWDRDWWCCASLVVWGPRTNRLLDGLAWAECTSRSFYSLPYSPWVVVSVPSPGTPIQNNMLELFSILNLLDPEEYPSQVGRGYGAMQCPQPVCTQHACLKFCPRRKKIAPSPSRYCITLAPSGGLRGAVRGLPWRPAAHRGADQAAAGAQRQHLQGLTCDATNSLISNLLPPRPPFSMRYGCLQLSAVG